MERLKNFLRSLVYPGLDLHTRNRATLCRYWKRGPRDVLDAGSGNGWFSWLAYRSGANVTAVNMDAEQVRRAKSLLIDYRGANPHRLRFEVNNLYALSEMTQPFDEIICFETLEHIKRDEEVCRQFFRLLKPGGVLHLCCPHRLHPRHQAEILDAAETGGHVRAGYTVDEYHRLLEPIGFQVDKIVGIGPPALYRADVILRYIREHIGDIAALPLFPFCLPLVWFARLDPDMPFSLYCRALKPPETASGSKSSEQQFSSPKN